MQQLKEGTLLQAGKYKIEKVLGQGGFGITYLATQELLDRKVAIKEFFYKDYCERDGATSDVTINTQGNRDFVDRFLAKFIKEARTISQLDHPNIIHIFDIFKENQTAYYVMEYIEGESLAEMVNRRGSIPEQEALGYIHPVADALVYVHQRHINHLDVKPGNIMVQQKDQRVVLIDFGLSKQYDDTGSQTSSTPVGISNGYAPIEQYKPGGVSSFSPQTDIYSLGATLYKLLTGQTPPSASDILNDGLPALPAIISPSVHKAIEWAMQIRKLDRPNSIAEWLNLFISELTVRRNNNNSDSNKSDENTKIAQPQIQRNINDTLKHDNEQGEKNKRIVLKIIILFISYLLGVTIVYYSNKTNNLQNIDSSPVAVDTIITSVAADTMVTNDYEVVVTDAAVSDVSSVDHVENQQSIKKYEEIFDMVEQAPQFPGGTAELMSWLGKNIRYPVIAQENGIQGRVICQFVVGSDGSVRDIKVMRGVDPSLDKEAVRVIQSMPKWRPGYHEGRAVSVRYTLPITFRLQ